MYPLPLGKLARCYVNRLTVLITNLSVRSPRNKPDERWRSHTAWYLLLDRDGRVTISAVCASINLLCDVHSGVLLVDGVRAGEQAVGSRPTASSHDSLSVIDNTQPCA